MVPQIPAQVKFVGLLGKELRGLEARPAVGLEDRIEVGIGIKHVGLHHRLNALPNLVESAAPLQKAIHGNFICRVKDGGQGAARFTGPAREVYGWEIGGSGSLKLELREFRKIERWQPIWNAVRPGDGVLNGEAHVCGGQLGEDGAVREFDHGVDDALRVDDDIHALHWDIKEPAGLDHFEALVEKGCGVDGDLAAHVPGGVFEGLCRRDSR